MVRIERRVIKVMVRCEGDLCDSWPKCRCAAKGYLNLNEPGWCGKKPTTRRVVDEERVDG